MLMFVSARRANASLACDMAFRYLLGHGDAVIERGRLLRPPRHRAARVLASSQLCVPCARAGARADRGSATRATRQIASVEPAPTRPGAPDHPRGRPRAPRPPPPNPPAIPYTQPDTKYPQKTYQLLVME